MRNYSLRSYQEDPDHNVHKARMMYTHQKLCAVFVEAQPDLKFFNKFIDDRVANLYFAKNKNQVLSILDYSKRNRLDYFFGIVDADDEVLTADEPHHRLARVAVGPSSSDKPSEPLFFSDLESLMAASDAYLHAFVTAVRLENIPPDQTHKSYARDVREKVRTEAAYLGCIHFAARKMDPAPAVSPILNSIRKFWNPNKNCINRERVLDAVSETMSQEEKARFKNLVEVLHQKYGNSWRLCRGHVISMLTTIYILKTNGTPYQDWKQYLESYDRNRKQVKFNDYFEFERLLGANFDQAMLSSSILGQQLMKFTNKKGNPLFDLQ